MDAVPVLGIPRHGTRMGTLRVRSCGLVWLEAGRYSSGKRSLELNFAAAAVELAIGGELSVSIVICGKENGCESNIEQRRPRIFTRLRASICKFVFTLFDLILEWCLHFEITSLF